MVRYLMEKYWEVSMGGVPDLEDFVRRAAQGEFGDVTAAHITSFLREVEAITIANIETKAQEGGPFARLRDQVIAETQQQVAELIAAYGDSLAHHPAPSDGDAGGDDTEAEAPHPDAGADSDGSDDRQAAGNGERAGNEQGTDVQEKQR